ncbi:MAG TPA: phenylacetate-CoA oxygenase subunit PaaI, partial [Promineifilum sp.]|nr:phenylacetate-CoA oxygenase subunit PaaI [Promineifilum sp.]
MIDPTLAVPLADRLLAMADDELILAHRNSEWAGHGPILEEDIAFANIALDEMGHAAIWYGLRSDITGEDTDRLVFFRNAGQYRNVQMVELP